MVWTRKSALLEINKFRARSDGGEKWQVRRGTRTSYLILEEVRAEHGEGWTPYCLHQTPSRHRDARRTYHQGVRPHMQFQPPRERVNLYAGHLSGGRVTKPKAIPPALVWITAGRVNDTLGFSASETGIRPFNFASSNRRRDITQ